MANTIVRQLGGVKDTITNRKVVCHNPKNERVQIKPGTVPKAKY